MTGKTTPFQPDRTRLYESGKMLLDIAKYFATVASIGALTNPKANWIMGIVGCSIAFILWSIGYNTIPKDSKDKEGS